jgi:hypothetical protein
MKWDSRFTILVDANLLLLLVVGLVDKQRIGKVGRTDGFDIEAFDLLVETVNEFRYRVTTPHVLTEASDLLCKGAHEPLASILVNQLFAIVDVSEERFVTARKLARDPLARPFGLADSGIIEVAQRGCSILSVDAGLCSELQRRHLSVRNFNHLRFGELS